MWACNILTAPGMRGPSLQGSHCSQNKNTQTGSLKHDPKSMCPQNQTLQTVNVFSSLSKILPKQYEVSVDDVFSVTQCVMGDPGVSAWPADTCWSRLGRSHSSSQVVQLLLLSDLSPCQPPGLGVGREEPALTTWYSYRETQLPPGACHKTHTM